VLSIDGKSFETRYKIPTGVSLKQDARSVYDQTFLRGSKPFLQPSSRGVIRTADLFSGCGGLSLGVREASVAMGKKFESAFALDSDESSLSVYTTNFNPVHALIRQSHNNWRDSRMSTYWPTSPPSPVARFTARP
jgi:hypothetical protein